MTDRLQKTDWLNHGLRMLAQDGPGSLKAQVLCAALGVSRGSFYWHFKDIDTFHSDLLAYWRQVSTQAIVDTIPLNASPIGQLTWLMGQAADGNDEIERAVRAWASHDTRVAKVMGQVDAQRLDVVVSLLVACGVAQQDAQTRGAFLYWANLGRVVAGVDANEMPQEQIKKLINLVTS